MRGPSETIEESLGPASLECLRRTRSSVLNVLVGVGVVVAVSGLVLRGRTGGALEGAQKVLSQAMLMGLFGIFVVSTIVRRVLGRRSRLRDPRLRGWRFLVGHVVPAAIGALAAPLGLVHGWLVSPGLEAILPFWVVAVLLGIVAYPRGRELEGFDQPMAPAGGPGS
ncbi:MAG: hypothetical protein ACP5XB_25425 [Isosphaeraceae bacterium]